MKYIKMFTSQIVLFLLIQNFAYAQRVHPDSTIIENEHFSFGIGISARQALITNNLGSDFGTITTRPALGYHASFFYLVKMGRTAAVEAGIKGGMQAWHYSMQTSPSQNPHVSQPVSHNNTVYTLDAEIPIRIIGRHIVSKNLLLFGFVGASLNYFKPVEKTVVVRADVDDYEVFEAGYEVPGNNPYLNFQLGMGGIKRVFGYPVKISLIAGVPFERRDIFEGQLLIKHPDNSNLGIADIISQGRYFGLELSYVLPLRNTWELMPPEY